MSMKKILQFDPITEERISRSHLAVSHYWQKADLQNKTDYTNLSFILTDSIVIR